MATYTYETIPTRKGARSMRYEIQQRMSEATLTKHPDTGQSIRRVITGGFGYSEKSIGRSVGMVDDYRPEYDRDYDH